MIRLAERTGKFLKQREARSGRVPTGCRTEPGCGAPASVSLRRGDATSAQLALGRAVPSAGGGRRGGAEAAAPLLQLRKELIRAGGAGGSGASAGGGGAARGPPGRRGRGGVTRRVGRAGPRGPAPAPPRRARPPAASRQWPLLCARRPRADGPQLQRPPRPPGPTWRPGPPPAGAERARGGAESPRRETEAGGRPAGGGVGSTPERAGVRIRGTPTVCQAPSVHEFSEPSKAAIVSGRCWFPCGTDEETEAPGQQGNGSRRESALERAPPLLGSGPLAGPEPGEVRPWVEAVGSAHPRAKHPGSPAVRWGPFLPTRSSMGPGG